MKIQKMVDDLLSSYNNAATIAADLGLTLDADRVKITIPRQGGRATAPILSL